MPNDLFAGYSERSDDELLHLATQRHSLTTEARAALDTELLRRNLTESDRIEHRRFARRQERRENRTTRRWKIPGLKNQLSWRDILEAFGTMALISFAYVVLPGRYHLNPDWQEAAFIVMITAVMIVFGAISFRKVAFWMSLGISSAIQLLVVHAATRRTTDLSRAAGRGAALLGLMLFAMVYAIVRYLQRKLYAKEAPESC
ncbi:MAG TPA: hypothetical protein VJO35_19585 [Terriglobales bacterium]|nr:hypothetical protein [Terriglobales bacterium]